MAEHETEQGTGRTAAAHQMPQCGIAVALGSYAGGGRCFSVTDHLVPGPRPGALSQTFSLPDRLSRAFGPGSFLPSAGKAHQKEMA